MKNFLRKSWDLWLVLVLVILQHRFWLFAGIYENFATTIGAKGEAYYNLSLYFQNALNFAAGHWFSLQGDHLAFYSHIIGVTTHDFAPSIVFAILYPVIKNPFVIVNMLFLGNLILLQLGMYLLAKRYVKNIFLAMVIALFAVLSFGTVGTFYYAHIHAALFWALPWLILFLEMFIVTPSTDRRRNILLAAGIFVTFGWLVFADWHVFLFSLIWIVVWLLFHVQHLIVQWQNLRRQAIVVLVIFGVWALALMPVAIGYFRASQEFNAVRTVGDVVATNFNTEEFYGIRSIAHVVLQTARGFVGADTAALLAKADERINHLNSGYPDPISAISFWGGLAALLPAIILVVWYRGRRYILELSLLVVFLVAAFVAIGPVSNIGGLPQEFLLLPYYFLYKVFFPLQSIRAVWRAAGIGYLALLLLWGMILQHLWMRVRRRAVFHAVQQKFSPQMRQLLKAIGIAYIVLLFAGVAVYQNRGFFGTTVVVDQPDAFLEKNFSSITKAEAPAQVFFWTPNENDAFWNLAVSRYNYAHGKRSIVLAAGGTAGIYPREIMHLTDMVQQGRYSERAVEILAAKKVDLVIENKQGDGEYLKSLPLAADALSRYYTVQDENDQYRIWRWQSASEHFEDTTQLHYFLTLSQYQTDRTWQVLLNIENPTDNLYVNAEPVDRTTFTVEFWQNGSKQDTRVLRMGETSYILPHLGVSFEKELKPKVEPGTVTVKLLKDGKELASSEVTVLTAHAYKQKLKEAKREELKITSAPQPTSPLNLRLEIVPTKLDLSIAKGVMQNTPQEAPISKNHPVIVQYTNSSGALYTGFPTWLNQPSCALNGNYFASDHLIFWCNQFLPFDETFSTALTKIDAKR